MTAEQILDSDEVRFKNMRLSVVHTQHGLKTSTTANVTKYQY